MLHAIQLLVDKAKYLVDLFVEDILQLDPNAVSLHLLSWKLLQLTDMSNCI